MNTVILKPAAGLRVRLPDGSGHLAATGEAVLMSTYWRRRIKDGDVEIIHTEATVTDATAESETKTTKVKK